MEPITTSAMVGAVVVYLAQHLKSNKSIHDFFGNFTDASVKWIRPLFLKEDNQPQSLLENLSKNPESLPRQTAVTSALEVALEDDPQAEALLREMYETIKTKGEAISIVNSKNVVTGNIHAGGAVTIGDQITQHHSGNGDNLAGNKIVYPPK
jgi:uncharacterized protein YqcC (DUF446 family)